MRVLKHSGELEEFNRDKFCNSLSRTGLELPEILDLFKEVEFQLYDKIPTSEIYKIAYDLLKSKAGYIASRYGLKKALLQLGPTGYPFEKYVGALMKAEGYKTDIGQIVKGKCVSHEIDVIAENAQNHFLIECKFHGDQRGKSDVKVPMYIRSRFEDVKAVWVGKSGHEKKFHQAWICTNTRFTDDAMTYGRCAGLNLLSWNYPFGNGLAAWIDKTGLYPITALSGLTKKEKERLIAHGVVLCRDLCANPEALDILGFKKHRTKALILESLKVCERSHPINDKEQNLY